MSTDYGTDLLALDDLPDPEVLCSGETNLAYAQARRYLTDTGALEDIGETEPYDSIDVRSWLGSRIDAGGAELADMQAQASQVAIDDQRIFGADVSVSFGGGTITLQSQSQGGNGPFSTVLQVSSVTTTLLRGT